MNLVPTKDSPKTRLSDKVLKISPNLQRLPLCARLHLNHLRNLEIRNRKLIVNPTSYVHNQKVFELNILTKYIFKSWSNLWTPYFGF